MAMEETVLACKGICIYVCQGKLTEQLKRWKTSVLVFANFVYICICICISQAKLTQHSGKRAEKSYSSNFSPLAPPHNQRIGNFRKENFNNVLPSPFWVLQIYVFVLALIQSASLTMSKINCLSLYLYLYFAHPVKDVLPLFIFVSHSPCRRCIASLDFFFDAFHDLLPALCPGSSAAPSGKLRFI